MTTPGPWIDPGVTYQYEAQPAAICQWYYEDLGWNNNTGAHYPEAEVPAAAATEFQRGLDVNGTLSLSGPSPGGSNRSMASFVTGWDVDHTAQFNIQGEQIAVGFDASTARAAFAPYVAPTPPEAVGVEYESLAEYLGVVSVRIGYSLTSTETTVTHSWRPAGFTLADMSTPRVYDPAGTPLWASSAPTGFALTPQIDVSSLADPSTGAFAIKSASALDSLTAPVYGEFNTRATQASWLSVTARYLCRAPRYRYLYDDTFTVAPPLRVHPRSDGLGLSSAVRVWPPPRSQQYGGRPAPGSYL